MLSCWPTFDGPLPEHELPYASPHRKLALLLNLVVFFLRSMMSAIEST